MRLWYSKGRSSRGRSTVDGEEACHGRGEEGGGMSKDGGTEATDRRGCVQCTWTNVTIGSKLAQLDATFARALGVFVSRRIFEMDEVIILNRSGRWGLAQVQ